MTVRYHVDIEHGGIPRWIEEVRPGGDREESYFEDLRLVNGLCWIPFRWTQERAGSIHRGVVESADFETPVDPGSLELTFDQPIPVEDRLRGLGYPPATTWRLDNLPSRSAAGVGKVTIVAASPGPPRDPLPGERDAPPNWPLWVLAAGIVGLLGVFVVWRRTVRRAA